MLSITKCKLSNSAKSEQFKQTGKLFHRAMQTINELGYASN